MPLIPAIRPLNAISITAATPTNASDRHSLGCEWHDLHESRRFGRFFLLGLLSEIRRHVVMHLEDGLLHVVLRGLIVDGRDDAHP